MQVERWHGAPSAFPELPARPGGPADEPAHCPRRGVLGEQGPGHEIAQGGEEPVEDTSCLTLLIPAGAGTRNPGQQGVSAMCQGMDVTPFRVMGRRRLLKIMLYANLSSCK